MYPILIVAILIVLVILYLSRSALRESFDTYHNHDMWADYYYQKQQPGCDPHLLAKYTWSKKDSTGRDIYDKYYEYIARDRLNELPYKDYARQDLDPTTDIYDTKFELSDNFGRYDPSAMPDANVHTVCVNGNILTLNQKNF